MKDITHDTKAHEHELEHELHATGYGSYILVWLGLLGLTAITVTLAGINLGSLALIVALVIATVKSMLVVNYFMHIKFDTMIFKIFVAICIIIFLLLTQLQTNRLIIKKLIYMQNMNPLC